MPKHLFSTKKINRFLESKILKVLSLTLQCQHFYTHDNEPRSALSFVRFAVKHQPNVKVITRQTRTHIIKTANTNADIDNESHKTLSVHFQSMWLREI